MQVYLGVPSPGQPPRRLVGFAKVFLAPSQTSRVVLTIDPSATNHPLSVWSDAERAFVVPRGRFAVYVGTSSADATEVATVTVS